MKSNQTTFNNAFKVTTLLQDQYESLANKVLEQIPGVPSEGRKAMEDWTKAFKEGRKNFKQQMDNGFEEAEKLFIIK